MTKIIVLKNNKRNKMKGFFIKLLIGVILITTLTFVFNYYMPYSKGFRSGELVKFTNKGVIFKTWEGEMSQGVSEAQRFFFSVENKRKDVIEKLSDVQGQNIKLTYEQRYFTFPWLSDTEYFIIEVEDKIKPDNTQEGAAHLEE